MRLVVTGFIRIIAGFTRVNMVSSGSFRFAWVHSVAPMCRRVHSSALWFTWSRVGVAQGFAWVHSSANRGRRVQSGSRWFIRAHVGDAGFILFRVG